MRMSRDYYATLGLPRNATDLDINKAYRNLSLRWHPTKNLSSRAEAGINFQHISEAFQVLSNRHLRKLYDRHGKEGLIEDRLVGLDFNGFLPRATQFPFRDPMDVYLEFFGGRDPIGCSSQDGVGNQSPFVYDEHCFENSFHGFPRPTDENGLHGSHKPAPYLFAGSMFSGPNDAGDYMSMCKTKKVINGKRTITKREVLNDEENVTIEEDGVLISKTINGKPQPL